MNFLLMDVHLQTFSIVQNQFLVEITISVLNIRVSRSDLETVKGEE